MMKLTIPSNSKIGTVRKLIISYLYAKELNLYGDTGNVEILTYRAKARGFDVEVIDDITSETNLVFMGGGPDSGQKDMYEDLLTVKGPKLRNYIENNGVALFICGSYQLIGHYYKAADGKELKGLGIFDLYTQHFGFEKPRCVGNISCELNKSVLDDAIFKSVNHLGNTLVGFENHGGRTYLGTGLQPFAKVLTGFGNNGEDKSEGAIYKNAIGTYFHGPILSKNPHLADYLIAKALKLDTLKELDDKLIIQTHTALLKKLS